MYSVSPATISALAEEVLSGGVVPEIEVFDAGMVDILRQLLAKGLPAEPYFVNILTDNGQFGRAPANAKG